MKNFYYKGIDLYGKKINGYMLASDKANAERQLIKNTTIAKLTSIEFNMQPFFRAAFIHFLIRAEPFLSTS